MLTDIYDDLIRQAGARYTVPFDWIKAVIGTESNFDPRAYRAEPQISDASYGLMQLLLKTARGLGYTGEAEGLYDPETNIDLGTKLLGQLIRRYGGNFQEVYSAYNSGSPTKYLSSSQVAAHVTNAVAWLQKVGGSVAGGAGFFALAAAALFLWRFTK